MTLNEELASSIPGAWSAVYVVLFQATSLYTSSSHRWRVCHLLVSQSAGALLTCAACAVVHSLVEHGDPTAAASNLKDLCGCLASTHASNIDLHLRLLAPITRLACGDSAILKQTQTMVQAAVRAARSPAQRQRAAQELVRQQMLSGNLQVGWSKVA